MTENEKKKPRCGSCIFFMIDLRDGIYPNGYCRKKSPPFPYTKINNWCGDFEDKEDE